MDLGAGVVEVVLARDGVAVVLEDPRERVAVSGVAPAGRDQHGVGFAETNSSRIRSGLLRPARRKSPARVKDVAQRVAMPGVGQEQVQEARTGDLKAVQGVRCERPGELVADPDGDVPWGLAELRRQQHRGVGRVVALAGALGALDPGGRHTARLSLAAQRACGTLNRGV